MGEAIDTVEPEVGDGFADELSRHSQKVFETAEPAMSDLAELAGALKMTSARELILESIEGLRRPSFTMIVFGRFSTGKSTFVNVLLGRLQRPASDLPDARGAPLPMDDMPVNARVTTIRYGEAPSVAVVKTDGSREQRSLKWFVENSPLRATHQESLEAFRDIAQFELTYPFENGKAGIVLIDTPGTDEASDRDTVALQALSRADAAILLFQTGGLAGQEEIAFARRMVELGLTNYFTVINRWNGRRIDERFKQFAWDKVVRELKNGPSYAPDRFEEQRVYFVDALAALEGRLADDDALVRGSGILEFEKALAQFYETDRRKVHVQRWVDQALGQAARMSSFIKGQIPVLMVERSEFERVYEEQAPRAHALEARKLQPAKVFERFRTRARSGLFSSLQLLYLDIAKQLPEVLKDRELSSVDGIGSLLWATMNAAKRQEIAKEVGDAIGEYVDRRMKAWETAEPPQPGARQILEPIYQDLIDELRDEISRTERDFGSLKLELAGKKPRDHAVADDEPESEWWTRIAPAAVGLVFGPDMAVTGARDGWKGFGKSLLVHLGLAVVLAAVGLFTPIGWGALVAGWIASFFARTAWRGFDLTKEMKQKAAEAFAEGLTQQFAELEAHLEEGIGEMIGDFEAAVSAGYAAEIDQQLHDIRQMQKDSALSRDEKAKLIALYESIDSGIARHIGILNHVRALAGA